MNHSLAYKCKNFFQAIDLYGAYPSLLIFGYQKYSSILGVLFTILASSLTFAYLVQEVQELVLKQLPQTILSEHLVLETSPFPLSSKNFTLAVSVGDMDSNPLTTIDKYFTISIENCKRIRQLNTTTNKIDVINTCINYPTEACTVENFVTDMQKEYFNKIRLGAVQCIKKEVLESNPPILQGIISGNTYQYIAIKFSACKNSTEKQDCATQEQINEELINGFYVVHISDSLVQMSNPQDIQQNFIKLQFTQFSISTSKTIYSGFRIIESITDNGVLTNNIVENQFLVQQYLQESTSSYNSDYLVNHFIILDNKYTSYQRSYIKLPTILSKIGGLWQLIFIIFGFITKPFIQTEMKINLANKLFRFQEEVNDLTQSVKKDTSTKQNLEKYVQKPGQKLPDSLINILQFCFGCNKKRLNSLNQANLRIQENLDIVEIMRKFQQLDNLKQVLLTANQKILFDLIPTPMINGQQQNKLNQEQHPDQKIKNLGRFIEAYKSFFQIQEMPEMNENIGQKIVKCLDQDMIKLFYEHQSDSEQRQRENLKQLLMETTKILNQK
ncbi:unnamed protein product (macronuclear) [Paramecium tetraurelia]|uniref:Transmembrane protein n=1 Tax=Paramecium tetraurelia TaxID=5888 RepID=A0EBT9_PARTE|nr:uncharacterized protein GSPATT00025491001 [Paramecium tetraurelia]CAK92756.1 unnamed protein product [Paramecium tetraurelia]|eukprot:XP_001460153.1 hypothetical protein (macronuclear) [Paramecium tetraurelia strain d4-2]